MDTLDIIIENEVKCKISPCPAFVYRLINDKTKIFDYRSRFTFAYQNKIWDGYTSFINVGGETYVQLLPEILKIFEERKIPYRIIDERVNKGFNPTFEPIDENYLSDIKWPKGHRLEGQPVELAEHQVRLVNSILSYKKCLVSAATGAGKTVVLACLGKKVSEYGRCLIVVPNSDLVLQTHETLDLMGVDCGRLMGQKYREVNHQTVVATWQSLMITTKKAKGKSINSKSEIKEEDINLSQDELETLLKDLKCIICDEVHTLTGKEIFKQFTGLFANVALRYGMSGTIPKNKAESIYLKLAIGDVVENVSTKELQEKNFLADSNVTVIKLKEDFNPTEGLSVAEKQNGKSWTIEKEYLQSNPKRLDFISNIIASVSSKGNTLVLCTTLKTGHFIEDRLKEQGLDVSYIAASMTSKKRQTEYKSINSETNKILISTVALASTGLNIPSLNRVILIDSGKSFQKNIQSLGRSLRLAKNKTKADIFDIGSDIGSSKNHIKERIKYYKEQGHKYQILEVKL